MSLKVKLSWLLVILLFATNLSLLVIFFDQKNLFLIFLFLLFSQIVFFCFIGHKKLTQQNISKIPSINLKGMYLVFDNKKEFVKYSKEFAEKFKITKYNNSSITKFNDLLKEILDTKDNNYYRSVKINEHYYSVYLLITRIVNEKYILCINLLDSEDIFIKKQQEFISVLNHEIKSPINNILVAQKSLMQTQDENKIKQLNEIIIEELVHFTNLYEALNEFSFLNFSESIWKNTQQINLIEFVQKICDRLLMIYPNQKIIINKEDKKNYIININPTPLKLIFNNLLINSIKYNLNNNAINVYLYKGNNAIEINIIDKGRGIDEKMIHKVFDKHQRAHSSDNYIEGKGLGLWIVKKIFEVQNIEYHLSSKPNVGTNFCFVLYPEN